MDQNGVPIFTPPQDAAPIFTPPKQERPNGPCCHHHKMEPAVTRCARCGKYICQDCAEAYGVSSGDYAGQSLCYDCTEEMVASNIEELKKNKNSIIVTFVLTIVGMIFGAIMGASMEAGAMGVLIGVAIGGCLWTFIKGFFARVWDALKGGFDGSGSSIFISLIIGCVVGFFIEAILSIYRTIRKIIECIIYLRRTSGFIDSDTRALQEMKDYMEYTQVMSMNKGVDLETLMNEGSQLYNNSYAQSVATNGEAAADAHLRQCVTTIAENGEIIRSFAA